MRQCPKCGKRFLADEMRVCDADGAELQSLVVTSARDRLVGAVVEGRYEIDGVLGDGGMGVVYRARAIQGTGTYAIKVLRAEYSSDEDLVTRFQQEAEAVYRIRHENIVQVYSFGTLPDGSRYFVMEYLAGQSLGQLLAEHRKRAGAKSGLPEARVLHIAKQICRGLHAAHVLSIVHRDMKPDNVHLVRRGAETDVVKVLDFGIAKVQGSRSARTRTGSVFGTPHYMSPEQASGERDIDPRTDVYAVGVLMYEMATGRVPFDADNLMGILTAHLYAAPVPPRQQPGGRAISEGLEAVILKALSKRRDARYASMEELVHDLECVERGEVPGALAEMDVATERWARADLPEGYEIPGGAAAGNDRLTVPAGKLSRPAPAFYDPGPGGTGPQGVIASPSLPPPSAVDAGAMVPVGTNRSIPPVTASSLARRAGAPMLAVALGVIAVTSFAAAGVILARRGETAASQSRPALPSVVTQGALAPPVAPIAPPPAPSEVPSATVMLQSDPPGAQVFLGRRRIGVTPLEVERPASGSEQAYVLVAPGRMRVTAPVRGDSPRAIQFALPLRPTGPRPGSERGGRGELLDPWATE